MQRELSEVPVRSPSLECWSFTRRTWPPFYAAPHFTIALWFKEGNCDLFIIPDFETLGILLGSGNKGRREMS